ncbi:uncharacterized protein LOC106166298 [Lingula anatina]|uniref:Uncharacterized protein LOC106166298 n=1 Tax=Lingula anatina TaxID=7574 RepID=A0A1S3IQD2_LINAN|nr:uncharacterized protein LOC106166298 [Lingula anatina]|eukprot:XP_013400278.1 uncharacterized protein LOC106166298 [Lingula anatina]
MKPGLDALWTKKSWPQLRGGSMDPDFFTSGLIVLEHRWSKSIALEGNYIEKEEVDLNPKKVKLVMYRLALVQSLVLSHTNMSLLVQCETLIWGIPGIRFCSCRSNIQ